MSSRYRSFITAIAGLILVGASDPPKPNDAAQNAGASTQIERAANSISTAITNAAKSGEQDRGCKDRTDKRDSDLCAQWKAADAARDAADYAKWTLLMSVVGTGLLVWTLWETRKTSRRQLRAYLIVEPKGITDAHEGYPYGSCVVSIKNCGQTPAYGLKVSGAVDYDEMPCEHDASNFQHLMTPFESDHTLGPGEVFHVYGKLEEIDLAIQTDIRNRIIALIQYGTVRYTDAFGGRRFTNYSYYHWGDELSDGNAKRCRKWNDAT